MRSTPADPFYGEGTEVAVIPRTSPMFRIQRMSWASAVNKKIMIVIPCHACPCTVLGLAQQCLAPVYGLGPGAPVGVLKFESFSSPYLCMDGCSCTSGKTRRTIAGNSCKIIKEALKLKTKR